MAQASISALDNSTVCTELILLTGSINNGKYHMRLLEKRMAVNTPFEIVFEQEETNLLRRDLSPKPPRYICTGVGEPFFTNTFDIENNYIEGLIVIDTHLRLCYEGKDWQRIENDHL